MNNAASNSGLINVPQAEHLAAVILPQHLRSPELENTRFPSSASSRRGGPGLDRLQPPPPPPPEKKSYPCY